MSSAYDLWIQEEASKVDDLIAFAIQFLTECEASKTWTRNWTLSMTCGYTAPGIGLLLQLFLHNGVSNGDTLLLLLKNRMKLNMDQFKFAINETIGNLLDMIPVCPVTQTQFGIKGLMVAEQSKLSLQEGMMDSGDANVYKVDRGGSNLVPGPNIISFALRVPECETFHHAVIYNIPVIRACYIIDSWVEPQGRECRPLSSRRHHAAEVYAAIDELNSDEITEARTNEILITYFMGHMVSIGRMIQITRRRIMVNTIKPDYIKHIYAECEKMSREGRPSSFGGKKRNKSKGTSKKRSKKYNRRSNRKHKIYRRTPVKNKKV